MKPLVLGYLCSSDVFAVLPTLCSSGAAPGPATTLVTVYCRLCHSSRRIRMRCPQALSVTSLPPHCHDRLQGNLTQHRTHCTLHYFYPHFNQRNKGWTFNICLNMFYFFKRPWGAYYNLDYFMNGYWSIMVVYGGKILIYYTNLGIEFILRFYNFQFKSQ